MYSRQLEDPDGNIVEFVYMELQAAEGAPTRTWRSRRRREVTARSYGQYCGVTTAVELTPDGRELEPIVLALGRWGSSRWAIPPPTTS